MSVYREKIDLFQRYFSEMQATTSITLLDNKEDIEKLADNYINAEYARWMNIFDEDGRKMIGFLIICTGTECHKDADYCVAHAFIEPAYRGQGYMTGRMNEYITGVNRDGVKGKEHKGIYCMYIWENNDSAAHFWKHYFLKKAGYERIDLDSSPITGKRRLLAFAPPKKK